MHKQECGMMITDCMAVMSHFGQAVRRVPVNRKESVMSDLVGVGYIVGVIWIVLRCYINKWKRDNPGKPVFEWKDQQDGSEDSYFETTQNMFTSDPQDKWLSPGGVTTEYYSYYSQADDDFRRNHE